MNLVSLTEDQILKIAKACHMTNKAYCLACGDDSQPEWEDTPDEIKQSAIVGVKHIIDKPNATPEDSHKSWLAFKERDGWTYGPVKDFEKKRTPMLCSIR